MEVREITLEEELKLLDESQPDWELEGFNSQEEYEAHYVALVDDLQQEAEKANRQISQRRMKVDQIIEQYDLPITRGTSRTNVNIVQQAMELYAALMCESMPRAKATARNQEANEFAGQLTAAMSQEYDATNFEGAVLPRVAVNAFKFFLGITKTTWDPHEKGEFDNRGRVSIVPIDPRLFHIDPYAKGYRLKQMRYLVVEEPMDLSEIRRRYPHKNVEPQGSGISINRRAEDGYIGVGKEYTVGQRHRAVLKECWLNSDVMWLQPKRGENGEIRRDSDGNILKEWTKKYPNGRLIITANGVMLVNQPNPFAHGEHPYSVWASRVSGKLVSWGDAEPLITLDQKMNRLLKDAMGNLRICMNTPWLVDRHAFDSKDKFNLLTNDPNMVIPITQGARCERVPVGELPQSWFSFFNILKQLFDDVLGVSGVNRGQLEKGAQLSAQAVSELQSAALARAQLKARLFEDFLKHQGYLLQWVIRQFYDADATISISKPGTDEKQTIGWTPDMSPGQHSIGIDVGSSLPGAKESNANLIMTLWTKGLLPRDWALRLMEAPQAEAVISDIKKREDELAGIEGGLKVVMNKRYNKTPGRRDGLQAS